MASLKQDGFFESSFCFSFLFAHDLFRKPLHTFRDHALRPDMLKNDLVGDAGNALAFALDADSPRQKGHPEDLACDLRCDRGQVELGIGYEMRSRAEQMQEQSEILLSRRGQEFPVRVKIPPFGDNAAWKGGGVAFQFN